MISYGALNQAENDVMGALKREGGKLSLPELTDVTSLPSGVVKAVVEQLVHKNSVKVLTEPGSGLNLIQVIEPYRNWHDIFTQWRIKLP
jgi:hypothetical protein